MIGNSKYYLEKSNSLGWGEDSARLEKERCALLKKYILGTSVLDVGCATGIYTDFIASLGYKSFGVDMVSEFIEKAKKTKRGIFQKGEARKLPFKNKSIDTIILFDILEHGDDQKILKEAKRVARKRILVIVPRRVDYDLQKTGIVFRHYIDKSHLREYKDSDFKRLAKENSLKLEYLKKVQPLPTRAIFAQLFKGPKLFKKLLCEIISFVFPKIYYPTEYFAVFDLI